MGLFKFFKKQLATVIEWQPQSPDALLWKYPAASDEIKNASKLIVSPGQGCMLVYEGKITDILDQEGTYNIRTDNHPFITSLLKIAQFFESEHKMGLYFYRKAQVVNQGWGTSAPIKYRDAEYHIPVELSAYGNFSYRLTNPVKLFTEFAGLQNQYTTTALRDLAQSRISQALTTQLAASKIPYMQIDARLNDLAMAAKEQLVREFEVWGVYLTDFRIDGNSFDEQTQERIGKVADVTADSLAAAEGGLTYVELEQLRALRDAAKNEGGLAGVGVALGAGMHMANLFTAKIDEVTQPEAGKDPITQLQKLKLLLDEEIITPEEFEQKKKEFLDKL